MESVLGGGSTFDGRGLSGAALYGGFKLAPETVRNRWREKHALVG